MRLNWVNDESERTQAASTGPGWSNRPGQPHHRLLSGIRRPVGSTGPITSPAGEHSSFGWRSAPGSGSDLRQRHILRAAHRLPVEVVGYDGYLLRLHGPSALSTMGRRRSISAVMAGGAGALRRNDGSGLELAKHGRGPDQIAIGRGGKPDPTPRTGARPALNPVY